MQNFKREETLEIRNRQRRTRLMVHLGFSVLLFLLIVVYREFLSGAVIAKVFEAAGYTYGPLLGLYAFGLFTNRDVNDRLVPIICLISPVLSYILKANSMDWFGFNIGFEILIYNGAITFLGLLLTPKRNRPQES